jgi:hypothetical protein
MLLLEVTQISLQLGNGPLVGVLLVSKLSLQPEDGLVVLLESEMQIGNDVLAVAGVGLILGNVDLRSRKNLALEQLSLFL